MDKLKILYWVSSEAHLQMCLPIQKITSAQQAVAVPQGLNTDRLVLGATYRYAHPDLSGVLETVKKFKPDVFVQFTSSRYFVDVVKKSGIKHVFSAHGVWPKSHGNKIIVADKFFQNFDMFLGASHMIKDVLVGSGNISVPIITNALVQFDTLHEMNGRKVSIRNELIAQSDNKSATRIVTLFGHNCTTKTDKLAPYNYGYYRAVVEIARLAEENNWLVFVKPKGDKDRRMIKESSAPWTKIDDVKNRYLKIKTNRNIKFLHHSDNPYKYLFADTLITTARSTVEVEAALLEKPMVRVFMPTPALTGVQKSYEYGAMDFSAVRLLCDISNMKRVILSIDDKSLAKAQREFIEHLGITFDGKANVRFLDAIMRLK